jgi:hypothetical protein
MDQVMKMTKEQFEATPEFKQYKAVYEKWEAGHAALSDVHAAYLTMASKFQVKRTLVGASGSGVGRTLVYRDHATGFLVAVRDSVEVWQHNPLFNALTVGRFIF